MPETPFGNRERTVEKSESDRRSSTHLASDTSSENSTPSGASLVCRMGTPPPEETIARLVMSEPRLRNTKHDISLRNHDRLRYSMAIVLSMDRLRLPS